MNKMDQELFKLDIVMNIVPEKYIICESTGIIIYDIGEN